MSYELLTHVQVTRHTIIIVHYLLVMTQYSVHIRHTVLNGIANPLRNKSNFLGVLTLLIMNTTDLIKIGIHGM